MHILADMYGSTAKSTFVDSLIEALLGVLSVKIIVGIRDTCQNIFIGIRDK